MPLEDNIARIADALEKAVFLLEQGNAWRQQLVASLPAEPVTEVQVEAPPEKPVKTPKPGPKNTPEPETKAEEPEALPTAEPEPESTKAEVSFDDIRNFVRTGYADVARKAGRKEAFQGLLKSYEVTNIDQLVDPAVRSGFFAELQAAFA